MKIQITETGNIEFIGLENNDTWPICGLSINVEQNVIILYSDNGSRKIIEH